MSDAQKRGVRDPKLSPIAAAMTALNERFLGAGELPLLPRRPGAPLEPLGSNRATPIELIKLVTELDDLTDQVEEADVQRWIYRWCSGVRPISDMPCEEDVRLRYQRGELVDRSTTALRRWRTRLDHYIDLANEAAAMTPEDRTAILYDVTAPLLLGWHYPEAIPLDIIADGYAAGVYDFEADEAKAWFDVQHVPDAMTPLILGHAFGVDLEFQRENSTVAAIKDTVAEYAQVASDAASAGIDLVNEWGKSMESFFKDAVLWTGVAALGAVALLVLWRSK